MADPVQKLTRAEAARRNGARSRGPTTDVGKARASRNALKHGLTAQVFALLPEEDAQAFADLLAALTRRYRPADALAGHLVQRLASVMWRQQRADRLEAEVLTQLEQRPDSSYIGGYLPESPKTWDATRFSAVQRQQARLDRAFFKLVDELERLEPEPAAEPVHDDHEKSQNEPEETAPVAAIVDPLPAGSPTPVASVAPPRPDMLPLTPELRALVEQSIADDAAARLLAEGRIRQANDFIRGMNRP